ncbi:MAG: Asp-tRNA(Asn)/Glu-tRNA(Gln) amidotransferase subunit GatA [Elusimicrobia bacterium]|nr:Asp-tRNA(Asn)/Glu-tRNA(Gln) amidotransferase subunit GatA [Elusimicrobiota bacterium]
MELNFFSASEIVKNIKEKKISCVEVTRSFLERSKKINPLVQSFLFLNEEKALEQAGNLDKKIVKNGSLGKLAGVPIAIKDNICVQDLQVTCSSKILQNFISPYDATVIKKLLKEDAIILGKTNLDEFAMGSSTENSAFITTKNPWDLNRVPGGSSGGSASAVSSRMAPIALGSDTGGSIRQPASFCGVIGLKPTYGRVSRFGLVAFASSLDQIGPFAVTAEDCALLLQVISGYDSLDSTSSEIAVPAYVNQIKQPLSRLRIGIPKEYFVDGLDQEVREKVIQAVKVFESIGIKVEEVSLPHTEYAISVYYILAPSEASANLARYDGVRYGHRSKRAASLLEMYENSRDEGFGPEVKRRIMLGTYALSSGYYDAYYAKAQKVRTLIRQDFEKVFEKVDVLITPTSPTPPFCFGEKVSDPLQMYLSDIFTISCNLAGLPGISIPCGFSNKGLPIGFQILGKPYDETTLLQMAYQYQMNTNWHEEIPDPAE